MPFAGVRASAVEQQGARALPHAGHPVGPHPAPPRRSKIRPGQGIYGFDERTQVSGSLI